MTAVYVDFSPVERDIKTVLGRCADRAQQERAVIWSLNRVGGKALTRVRRELVQQTSVPYGRIMAHVVGKPAHSNRMSYIIEARDKALPLKEFLTGSGAPGRSGVRYRAWGQSLVAKHAFFITAKGVIGGKTTWRRGRVIKSGGGELIPVKRVRSGHDAGSLKALWGPVVPLQMLSENRATFHYIETIVPREFVPVLEGRLAYVMSVH